MKELESYILGCKYSPWHKFTETTKTNWVLSLNFSLLTCETSVIVASILCHLPAVSPWTSHFTCLCLFPHVNK